VIGTITPVQPRCVKPWVVPNLDPLWPAPSGGNYCGTAGNPSCNPLVNLTNGSITHKGISLGGTSANGVIGETFWLSPDCRYSPTSCTLRTSAPSPNYYSPPVNHLEIPPSLQYVPGQVTGTSVAVPSTAAGGSDYEQAVAGCDQSTLYQCGVPSAGNASPNIVDLSVNPDQDTTNGVLALIHQSDSGTINSATGQDTLNPFGAPAAYPFQVLAGTANPLVGAGLTAGGPVTNSNSIVSLPIYDQNTAIGGTTTPVTIIGFVQVFINAVDPWGNVNVTVLNVAGCGNGSNLTAPSPVTGSSPVPVRLITPPS